MPGASAPGGQADVTRRKADILLDLDRQHREEREDEAGRYLGLLNQLQANLAPDPSKHAILTRMRHFVALRGRWAAFHDLVGLVGYAPSP